ncbi:MAG: hypothetical protein H0T57_02000 [Rubrobacter sp.]|nr:hypothetical protein [Rubrobacter sp.]MBA3617839.1 hypothetical protein [Rubrobacteraceae bacterium]
MAKCAFIKPGGDRCKATATEGYDHCYGHRPDLAEERRRNASKGGRRGGRGRPASEISKLKSQVRAVIGGVLSGKLTTKAGAVALQGYNTLLKAAKVELDIREQSELIERMEELESMLERQNNGRSYGRV